MSHSLFFEKMKVADLVHANYRLLYVLPCFSIELGLGELTIKQLCEKKNISVPLFLLVCNLYTFDNYFPEPKRLTKIPLAGLIDYIRSSHTNYLEDRMPKIISQIMNMVNEQGDPHGNVLTKFCEKYRKEVVAHFNYEEQTVFPYIELLLKGEKTDNYNIIKEYKATHSDLDAALSDLKNIIIKYLPAVYPFEQCRNILIDLSLFESDLSKHTLLEDKILIALVEQMEKETR